MTSIFRWLLLGWATFNLTAAEVFAQESDALTAVHRWIEDLGHDQYLRRETANRKLAEIGSPAIKPLVAAIASGDLEVTERAMDVITEIGLSSSPSEDGGAWDQLNQIAAKGAGQTASRAELALAEIRAHRARQAREALKAAGVFIGLDQHFSLTTGQHRLAVRVDDRWDGDVESLEWMRWLYGIENALIKGKAGTRSVLEQIVKIPNLKSLAIIDAKVDQETLQPLKQLTRIEDLEFRYVALEDSYGELIASLQIRTSLELMGTGISDETVESMRQSLPGLTITHRQGGFLGVRGQDSQDFCEISEVVQGSAAHEAGLLPGDTIVQIGEAKVKKFDDLLKEVSRRIPGDTVEVQVRRGGQVMSLQLTLGRFPDK